MRLRLDANTLESRLYLLATIICWVLAIARNNAVPAIIGIGFLILSGLASSLVIVPREETETTVVPDFVRPEATAKIKTYGKYGFGVVNKPDGQA